MWVPKITTTKNSYYNKYFLKKEWLLLLPGKGENIIKIQEGFFGILNSLGGNQESDEE